MFSEKVVVVTGGAQGIGRHAALTLARHGARTVIADLDIAVAERTARDLGAMAESIALPVDVGDEARVAGMLAQVHARYGRIDVLINNAGVVPHFLWGLPLWPRVADMPLEFWDRVIRTNLYGTFLCTKHVVPYMRERRSGHIVNLYGGGFTNPPGAMAYAVTKDAIRTFTRYLAEDVREMNICAVTFSPRLPIATESAPDEAKQRLAGPEALGEAFVLAAQLPMERSGQCVALNDGALVVEDPMAG